MHEQAPDLTSRRGTAPSTRSIRALAAARQARGRCPLAHRVQRRCATAVARVEVGAAFQQRGDRASRALRRRKVQGRRAVLVVRVGRQPGAGCQLRCLGDWGASWRRAAILTPCLPLALPATHPARRARPRAALQQQAHDGHVVVGRRQVQRAIALGLREGARR